MTFKSFQSILDYERKFESDRQAAIKRDECSRAWKWFESSIGFKDDAVVSSLRRVNSHGRKGVYFTMAPLRRRASCSANSSSKAVRVPSNATAAYVTRTAASIAQASL